MLYALIAENLQERWFVSPETTDGWLDLVGEVSVAKLFDTEGEAIAFAAQNCGLQGLGASYDWSVVCVIENTIHHVQRYIQAPRVFITVGQLKTWLKTLFPFEYVGRMESAKWRGIAFDLHEPIKRVEVMAQEELTSVAHLLNALQAFPEDVELFDVQGDGDSWYPSVCLNVWGNWELGNYVPPTNHGFVKVHDYLELGW